MTDTPPTLAEIRSLREQLAGVERQNRTLDRERYWA